MQIRVSEIPEEGRQITDPAEVGPVFPDPGWALDAVSLLVGLEGRTVTVTGQFDATVQLACGRCLEPVTIPVSPTVDLQFVPPPSGRQGETELGRDDLEVDFYVGDLLDVGSLIRSETDLALPMRPLCRPDCRGLCPVCGGNRNVTDCRCQVRSIDPRLAPLEALRRPQ
jgi:uncharacterized protein